MPSLHPRSKRFRRVENERRPMYLTARDLEILRLVAEHRFLSSVHLHQWLGGSRQNLLRRLHRLFHHGYLDRPTAQLDYFHRAGSRPMVYGLGRRGAGRLRRDLNLPFARLDWAGRPRPVGRLFLEHTLLVAEVVTAFERACRRHGGFRLVLLDGLNPENDTREHRRRWQWSVTVPSRQRIGVAPDRVIALEPVDPLNRNTRQTFFIEADRGTMPITRSNPRLSSVARKLLAYEATWSQGVHQSRLGLPRFRTLVVTTSQARTTSILKQVRALPRGRGLFLCTDTQRLAAAEDILSSRCWDGASGPQGLDGAEPPPTART